MLVVVAAVGLNVVSTRAAPVPSKFDMRDNSQLFARGRYNNWLFSHAAATQAPPQLVDLSALSQSQAATQSPHRSTGAETEHVEVQPAVTEKCPSTLENQPSPPCEAIVADNSIRLSRTSRNELSAIPEESKTEKRKPKKRRTSQLVTPPSYDAKRYRQDKSILKGPFSMDTHHSLKPHPVGPHMRLATRLSLLSSKSQQATLSHPTSDKVQEHPLFAAIAPPYATRRHISPEDHHIDGMPSLD